MRVRVDPLAEGNSLIRLLCADLLWSGNGRRRLDTLREDQLVGILDVVRKTQVLWHVSEVAVSVEPASIIILQGLESSQQALICVELLIIQRLQHGEDPSQLTCTTDLNEV